MGRKAQVIKEGVQIIHSVVGAVSAITGEAQDVREWLEGDERHVIVPNLLDKQYPMLIETAKESVENSGLVFVPDVVQLNNIDSKYKDCCDGQVVYSNPKSGTKTIRGSQVRVVYVTSEVIKESQRVYDEEQQKKTEKKEAMIDAGKTFAVNAKETGKVVADKVVDVSKIIAVSTKDTAVALAGGAKDTVSKIANRQDDKNKY